MLTEQQKCDITNAVRPDELARLLVKRLPDEAQKITVVGRLGHGGYVVRSINSEYVPVIAECLQEIVAYTVSTLIDAGSERDAVMESMELMLALNNELNEWTEREAHQPSDEEQAGFGY